MWLVGVGGIYGVATGCGCKEVYTFPHSTYPYSSCICSFLQQHPYFLFFFLYYISIGLGMQSVPLCTSIMASPLNLSSFMDDLVHNFRRRRAEKDLSHNTLPTEVAR